MVDVQNVNSSIEKHLFPLRKIAFLALEACMAQLRDRKGGQEQRG